jgi:hypothetical protein
MDVRDLELLRRIKMGERVFKPSETADAKNPFPELVARLIHLSERGWIRMPSPRKSFMSADGGYIIAGPCELTTDGYNELERAERLG